MRCQTRLLLAIEQRKLEYFGHIMRHENKYRRLLENIMQGRWKERMVLIEGEFPGWRIAANDMASPPLNCSQIYAINKVRIADDR